VYFLKCRCCNTIFFSVGFLFYPKASRKRKANGGSPASGGAAPNAVPDAVRRKIRKVIDAVLLAHWRSDGGVARDNSKSDEESFGTLLVKFV
jgi:hypothetical protein